jgi:hypothetical protein
MTNAVDVIEQKLEGSRCSFSHGASDNEVVKVQLPVKPAPHSLYSPRKVLHLSGSHEKVGKGIGKRVAIAASGVIL